MKIKSNLLLLFTLIYSSTLLAEYEVKKVSKTKKKVVVNRSNDGQKLSVGDLLEFSNDMDETCKIKITKVKKKTAIGDSSKCSIKDDLESGSILKVAGAGSGGDDYDDGDGEEVTKSNSELEKGIKHNAGRVSYVSIKGDGDSASLTGYSFGGDLRFGGNFLLSSHYTSYSYDIVSTSSFDAGLSYILQASPKFDLLLGVGYNNTSISLEGYGSASAGNFAWRAQGVALLGQSTQFKGTVYSVDGNMSYSVGIELFLGPSFALTGSYSFTETTSGFSIGLALFSKTF